MSTIRVIRTSEYINRLRNYGIYIDDKKAGEISNGKTQELELSQGTHTIYAKIDWCYSPVRTFSIDQTGTTIFKVGGFKTFPLGLLYFLSFGRKKYLTLTEETIPGIL